MKHPSTEYLRQLNPGNGWQRELVHDRHGQPHAIVAVRVGEQWTDSVAIEGEDRCVAMRHRTHEHRLVVSAGESMVVWRRDGDCTAVLAELFELPTLRGDGRLSALHSETRGRFRWLETVECDEDAGVTIHTARAQLRCGLVVERVRDEADVVVVSVTDLAGCEVTLATEQSVELGAALDELPAP